MKTTSLKTVASYPENLDKSYAKFHTAITDHLLTRAEYLHRLSQSCQLYYYY